MARVAEARENWPEARQYHEESLAIFRELPDPVSVAWSLEALARIDWHDKRLAPARALIEEAVSTLRPVGSRVDLARVLATAGRLAATAGDLTVAQARLEESLAIAQALNDPTATAQVRRDLAGLPATQVQRGEA
jgi:hypothetical protein